MEIIKFSSPAILTCVVTHNRKELTELTINSYLNTIQANHFLVVVDNNSDAETKDYLVSEDRIDLIIWNNENKYPGAACNQGWEEGLKLYPEATLLHRSDNDIFYRIGWDVYVLSLFAFFDKLGLFGLMDLTDKHFFGTVPTILYERAGFRMNTHLNDVGGSYLLRRQLWDSGIRHIEEKWNASNLSWEDHVLSEDVRRESYLVCHALDPLACHLGIGAGYDSNHKYYDYYLKSNGIRGITDYIQFLRNKAMVWATQRSAITKQFQGK